MGNQPEKKYRIGSITATIWKNDNGEKPFYTVDVQRVYKDADDKLQNTGSFSHADIPVVMKVLERAEEYIALL